ncbi:MAG: carbamoyltransferase HypF [Victivallales bacterium]|nr:carbamoyltransferase HypF [Victivallales bacterium]
MKDIFSANLKFDARFAETASVLAFGAESESSIAIVEDSVVKLFGPFGDLKEPKHLKRYLDAIEALSTRLGSGPKTVAFDMHPGYTSTRRAAKFAACGRIPVQHHHAHATACMLENALQEKKIAVVFDGMGFGGDGGAWGGEFLLCDFHGFERAGHLKSYPMPGGDAATLHPERMAFSYLVSEFGADYPGINLMLPELSSDERAAMRLMLEKGVNCPETSSAGRLFDAVAAMTGFSGRVEYGAQAAIELERSASLAKEDATHSCYEITDGVLCFAPLFDEMRQDIENRVEKSRLAYRFHNALAAGTVDMCERIGAETGIRDIVLSGGVFNNKLLTRLIKRRLKEKEFNVFTHKKTTPGDANIALGQAVVAACVGGKSSCA